MNLNFVYKNSNITKNIIQNRNKNNFNLLNDLLFQIKNGNIDDRIIINTFTKYLQFIKKFNFSEEEEKIGFLNLFFERVIWTNQYGWKPVTPYSFLVIHYLGMEKDEINESINSFLNPQSNNHLQRNKNIILYIYENLKRYKISKNIFYIGDIKEINEIVLFKIKYLLSMYKKGGLRNSRELQRPRRILTESEIRNINKTTNSVNLIHKFASQKNELPTLVTRKHHLDKIFKNIIHKKTNSIYLDPKFSIIQI